MVSMGHRDPKSHFLSFRMSRVTKSVNEVWEGGGDEDSSGRGNCETEEQEGFQKSQN